MHINMRVDDFQFRPILSLLAKKEIGFLHFSLCMEDRNAMFEVKQKPRQTVTAEKIASPLSQAVKLQSQTTGPVNKDFTQNLLIPDSLPSALYNMKKPFDTLSVLRMRSLTPHRP